MIKFSKYFSLFKFSITHPKEGVDMFTAAHQSHEDSKQNIKEHTAISLPLEKTLNEFFPKNGFVRTQLIENTKELQNHFKNYFEKMRDENFPSKKKPYPTDYSINEDSRLFLYALCKIIKPEIVVETGVAYGISSAYILQALHENDKGTLYSIDNVFKPWESREMIGNAIPKNLQNRWKLTVGTSSEKLEKIFQSIEKADIFLHDSLHTYKNMLLEFQTAWPFIKNNGYLLSDDIGDNNAFLEFYLANEGHPILLKNTKNVETTLGILRKN